MTSFLTPIEFKAYPLPITDNQYTKIGDVQLQKALDTATIAVQNWLNRMIISATYTEVIRGNGRPRLVLEGYPLISLTGITGTDEFGTANVQSTGDFLLNSGAGIVEWKDTSRNAFWKTWSWTITYVAGYATVPDDVKHATALQAVILLEPVFRGNPTMAPSSIISNANETIVDLLEPYKRKRMG